MKKLSLALALAFASLGASALPVVIDTFNGDTNTASSNGTPAVTTVLFGNSSEGFAREATIASTGSFVDTSTNTATNPGVFAHSQGAGVFGSSLMSYTLPDVDLTGGMLNNAFRVALTSADLSGAIEVGVSDGGPISFFSLSTDSILLASGLGFPANADFLFSSFPGIDFTSVNTVYVKIDGSATAAFDATVDNFGSVCSSLTSSGGSGTSPNPGVCSPPTTVAEPASLALVGLALAAAGFVSRRKKA